MSSSNSSNGVDSPFSLGIQMKLSEIKEALKAEMVFGDESSDIEIERAAASDLMSDLLRGPMEGVLVLSGLNNLQAIRTSVIAGVAAVVFVRGKRPDEGMIAQAKKHGLPLLSTPFTMFTACGRVFGKGLRGVDQKNPG